VIFWLIKLQNKFRWDKKEDGNVFFLFTVQIESLSCLVRSDAEEKCLVP